MKGNKSALLALAMFAGLAQVAMTGNSRNYVFEEDEPATPKKKPIPNGCKEYTFYGVTVVALNEASAIKKCKKKAGVK